MLRASGDEGRNYFRGESTVSLQAAVLYRHCKAAVLYRHCKATFTFTYLTYHNYF
jgi:hypothetical protein